jgi:hypothetical protein
MANGIKQTSDKDLNLVLGFADEYLEATEDSRTLSEKCRDYFDGYQWTEAEKRKLKGRPCITNNRIKPKVQFLKGMETQNRADPKALPREPNDDKAGEVATDAMRFVEENNASDQEFSDGFSDYLIEGVEGHEVVGVVKKGNLEVRHNQLPWDRIFYDPHSRKKNFSDARYKGTLQWMDEEEARNNPAFEDAPEEFFTFSENEITTSDTFEDKPLYFIDKERKRIRVFFCYYLKGSTWMYCVFSGGGFAIRPTPSPYLDEDGDPEPQFEFQSAFVDRHGNRYGEVASYLDLQDEINHRHSKFLHLMSVRQTWGSKGAVQDVTAHKRELAKADGHVEFGLGKWGENFGIIPTSDMAQGQALLLQEAKANIDVQGANAVMQGDLQGATMSGKAVQSLQQGGVVELGSLFDGHSACRLRVYRMMFNRIKQFWTEERWVRVLGDDSKIKWTGLNQGITLRDKIIEEFGGVPAQFENDPRLDVVVEVANPVNELDVDIIMDQAADTLSLQHEQFDLLVKMYQSNPQAVPFQLVIKASQLRNKEELIKMIEGGDDEQKAALQEARQQEEREIKELAKMAAIRKVQLDESTAKKNDAAANKMNQESKNIIVDTALDMHRSIYPQELENAIG